jgi:hypothetical protein
MRRIRADGVICTLADSLERDGYGMTPISRLIVATRPDKMSHTMSHQK